MKTEATPTGSDDFTLGFRDAPVGRAPVSASEAKAIAIDAYICYQSIVDGRWKAPPVERAA